MRIKNFINLLYNYRKILVKVIIFEIYYTFKHLEFTSGRKIHHSNFATDTVPCPYYFLFRISKFIKEKKIKSVLDLGSGYGRVVNFISHKNNIRAVGIELDKDVYKKSQSLKKPNVKIFCDNILRFNLSKFNSQCFILNDPLKKKKDKKKLINKILKLKNKNRNKILYIVSINMNKKLFSKNFKLLKNYNASEKKTLNFFKSI